MKMSVRGPVVGAIIMVLAACVAKASDAGRESSAADAAADGPDVGTIGDDGGGEDGCASINWFTGPGCVNPPRRCQPDWDACASVMCDCQGNTFTGMCGWSSDRPFSHYGACGDAGSD